MGTFSMGKSADDVQEPILLDEDWYTVEIAKDPTVEKNAKMRDNGPDFPGAGYNVVVPLKVISEVEEYNGRRFTMYMSLPTEDNKTEWTAGGQTMEDFKLQKIVDTVEGFGGNIEGEEFSLEAGARAQVYVIQEIDQNQNLRNSLDIRQTPRPVV